MVPFIGSLKTSKTYSDVRMFVILGEERAVTWDGYMRGFLDSW